MRFTIRCMGSIVGTYPGQDEAAALDAMARDHKSGAGKAYANFAAYLADRKLKRDNFTVEEVR